MLRNAGACNSDTRHKVLGKVRFGVRINPLQPSGHYMYRHFNVQQFMCFVWISEQTAIIFLYNIN